MIDIKGFDLPKRIVSFEQKRHYFKEVEQELKSKDLINFVDLDYSPLKETVCQGKEYLFYGCEKKLDSLANVFQGRHARILVVVDGPYDPENVESRYPALPLILHHLSAHKLDIILDDYHREAEKKIIEDWCSLLTSREAVFTKTVFPFEKGACMLSIDM